MSAWSIKIYKSWGGRATANNWANVYHLNVTDEQLGVESEKWAALALQLVAWEQGFHLGDVNFMRAVISSITKEPVYTPSKLRVMEISGVGQRAVPGDATPVDLNMALKAKKNVAYGRSGTAFYRGMLHTKDVIMGAGGTFTLAPTFDPNMGAIFNGFDETMAEELAAMPGHFIIPFSNTGDQTENQVVRIWETIKISGVTYNKRNHRYFDKAQSDDGIGVGT